MDDKIEEIQKRIDSKRRELGRNFEEIEDRVKRATNIKTYFNEHTGLIVGAAVAGGLFLSTAFNKSARRSGSESEVDNFSTTKPRPPDRAWKDSRHLKGISSTLDNIVDGLIGVASGKLVTFIADSVPGFIDHYESDKSQRNRSGIYDTDSGAASQRTH